MKTHIPRTAVRAQDPPPRVRLTQLAEALFDGSPHGLVLTDEDGTIGWVNRRFATATQRSPVELEGRNLDAFVGGADKAIKKLRTSDSIDHTGQIRGAEGPASKMQMHAVRSHGRGPTTILWWMADGSTEKAPEGIELRPAHGKTNPSPTNSFHLDALRLLHEFAISEEPSQPSVGPSKPQTSFPLKAVIDNKQSERV